MKKVKLSTMTKESIADIEKEIINSALNLVKEKQAKFKDLGLTINAEFGRFVFGKK
ncbi:hypothetical protein [Bacillus sp. FSL W7-1085]|uniref:hypothetical protein n=2 Tax=unclassified Bacillus (in: firmicutes) TaxID=185979 RepID=UPI00315A14E4